MPFVVLGQIDTEYRNYAPIFSPNQNYITWYAKVEGNWDLYNYSLAHQDISRLTRSEAYEGEPSWSPDELGLVFTSDKSGSEQIYMLSVRTTGVEQVTDQGNPKDYPTYSPDGRSIYYREKEGKEWHLFKMELASRKSERINKIPIEGRFRISTNGESISFVTKTGKKFAIVRVDLEGYLLSKTETQFNYPGNPHYSDELGLFVFDAHADGEEDSGNGDWEIWTIDKDGENLERLTNNRLDDWGPYWSSNGSKIVYSGGGLNNTGYEIFIMDLTSGKTTQLSSRK